MLLLFSYGSNFSRISRRLCNNNYNNQFKQFRYLNINSDYNKLNNTTLSSGDNYNSSNNNDKIKSNWIISTDVSKKFIKRDGRVNPYEDRYLTIPNVITVTRMCVAPGLGAMIMFEEKLIALSSFIFLGFTDWLDGYIAKNYNQSSTMGAILDPIADKVLIGIVASTLAVKGLLPFSLACTIVGRDVCLIGASFAIRYGNDEDENYDSNKTITVIPSTISKVNTVVQVTLLTTILGLDSFYPSLLSHIEPLYYLTYATTITSFVGYLDGSAVKKQK